MDKEKKQTWIKRVLKIACGAVTIGFAATVGVLFAENRNLRTTNSSLDQKNKDLEKENEELEKKNSELEKENSRISGENRELEKENDRERKENKNLAVAVGKLTVAKHHQKVIIND